MERAIKFLSLQKSELEYEVGLRGDTPADNVIDLRKQITKLWRGFSSEDILESHLDSLHDLKGARECLIKSQNYISNLTAKFDKNMYSRTENLLNHVYHRLNRINPTGADEIKNLAELNKHLQSQTLELKKIAPSTSTNDTNDQKESTTIAVTCDRGISADLFKLKYDGKTCVHSFIQRVEEFIRARNISADKVLSFATEIFTDNALHWYRSIRNTVDSWDDVVLQMKQDFGQFDYDYRLMSEIRSRSQGESESITIYLSIMHCMFSRLSRNVPEDEKLEILLHNIRPCYANILASCSEIKTIDALRNQCRNYEIYQSRLQQFREPPKITSETLAPEFAYNRPNTSQARNYNNTSKPNNNIYTNKNESVPVHAVDIKDKRATPYCPRCRTNDHSLKNCVQPKFLICFKCGKKDVSYPTCPDCVKPPNYPFHRESKN